MLVLTLLYIYIFFITVTIGHLLSMLFFKDTDNISIDLLSLIGFIGLTSGLNILHLFCPLGGISPHLFVFFLIFLFRKKTFQNFKNLKYLFQLLPFFYIPMLCIFVVTVIAATISPLIWDSASYHIQILQWFEKYAVVPGLANIHTRLALHSIVFPTMAFFDFSFAFGQPFFPVNSYFNLLIIGRAIYEIRKDCLQEQYGFALFEGFFLFFNLNFLFCKYLSSPSPDYLANMLLFYVFLILKQLNDSNKRDFFIIVLCTFLPFVKLGQLLFIILPLFLIRKKESIVTFFTTTLILGFPFLIHNYIQTGYVFYPISFANIFNPDWKLPLSTSDDYNVGLVSLTSVHDAIIAWARMPYTDASTVLSKSFSQWFPIWFQNSPTFQKTLLLFALLSPFFSLILWKLKRLNYDWLIFNFICWSSIGFWLITAPDFRFSYGFMWGTCLLPLLYFNFKKVGIPYISSILPIFLSLLLVLAHRNILTTIYSEKLFSKKYLLLPPEIPKYSVSEKECLNFRIKTSTENGKCGGEEVPCSPNFQNNLEKRGLDFSSGFHIKNKE